MTFDPTPIALRRLQIEPGLELGAVLRRLADNLAVAGPTDAESAAVQVTRKVGEMITGLRNFAVAKVDDLAATPEMLAPLSSICWYIGSVTQQFRWRDRNAQDLEALDMAFAVAVYEPFAQFSLALDDMVGMPLNAVLRRTEELGESIQQAYVDRVASLSPRFAAGMRLAAETR